MSGLRELPNQVELEKLFDYDTVTGALRWKVSPANRVKVGDTAGSINCRGYVCVAIKSRFFLAHRLVWKLVYGVEPPPLIDHINGEKTDNRAENLRAASAQQNNANVKRRKTSALSKGVSQSKGKYVVRVQSNGVQIFLGAYADIELAELVAQEARVKYHGEFARHA